MAFGGLICEDIKVNGRCPYGLQRKRVCARGERREKKGLFSVFTKVYPCLIGYQNLRLVLIGLKLH